MQSQKTPEPAKIPTLWPCPTGIKPSMDFTPVIILSSILFLVMALGGLLAALDRRYRLKLKREKVAVKPIKNKQAIPATS